MAIELPGEVAQFLQFIGIPWINVNEDKVREFATETRKFASNLSDVHQNATATLDAMGSGWQGAAYEALMRMWGAKTTSHISEVTKACGILADALDVGAEVIEGQKIYCIGELVVMAAEFAADQAAAVVTLGASEAALPLIEEATDKLMEFAEQQVEQYFIGELTNAALQPLIGKLEGMVEGLVFGGGEASPPGDGYEVDTGHIQKHMTDMSSHADTAQGHISDFTGKLRGMDFTS